MTGAGAAVVAGVVGAKRVRILQVAQPKADGRPGGIVVPSDLSHDCLEIRPVETARDFDATHMVEEADGDDEADYDEEADGDEGHEEHPSDCVAPRDVRSGFRQ